MAWSDYNSILSKDCAIIWFLWVVECSVHLKKLPEKLWWNNPPSWFTLHHPLLFSIFCTQAQLSVKFLLMMSTSSQLVIVCLLQMQNGQDNVSVIVVDFGYRTIHPLFLLQISQVLNWHSSLIQQSYWRCGRFCRKVQANGASRNPFGLSKWWWWKHNAEIPTSTDQQIWLWM